MAIHHVLMLVRWEARLQVGAAAFLGQSWITIPGASREILLERLDSEQKRPNVGSRILP